MHIHHTPGADDEEVTRAVRLARYSSVPVAVTAHDPGEHARAWEAEADALVATSSWAAARLRERWPSARVVHLPPACPTWFPPRKPRPGRVVAIASHPGNLLASLRAVPGVELLPFDDLPDGSEDDAVAIARRLAAHADVIVYGFGPAAAPFAGYSVTRGLASGVPVVALPAPWLSDLAETCLLAADPAEGVGRVLGDVALRRRLADAARAYCQVHDGPADAARHVVLWRSLGHV